MWASNQSRGSFAKHRVNCLVSDPKDVASIVQNLIYLLTDSDGLATKLLQAGLSTAKLFSWQMVGDRLEKALTSLADTQPLLDQTGMFTPQMMQNFVVANARVG
ncbi:hypothetical protein CYMTET_26868 [Cymbomonas tetramitiformis]|uniref:Uncharacterized protein n=1 Tax=Cymbomonas tetramitiformis TaxID=36881 RepID=A0AAE0KXH8_9CHLO|nr:hypothetical protein CYMTET_26868 [Cymbomonas tetramitiformis]